MPGSENTQGSGSGAGTGSGSGSTSGGGTGTGSGGAGTGRGRALRRLWSLPLGRLAVACVLLGTLGLAAHLWLPVLTLIALPRTVTP